MSTTSTPPKQHAILAVEPTREAAAKKQLAECPITFANKHTLFTGNTRTLTLFNRDTTNQVEFDAIEAKDHVDNRVQYTVGGNLNYMAGIVGSWLDVNFTKEATNQIAKADVVIGGLTLIKDAPATYLLGLENKLGALRQAYEAIPTLAPGINWEPATDIGPEIWKGPEVSDTKTLKTTDQTLLKQSSDKHPDVLVNRDVIKNIGQYKDRKFSGMIPVAEKAAIIARFDQLLMAVKEARQRANDVNAVASKCSETLFGYLHGKYHDADKVKAALSGT